MAKFKDIVASYRQVQQNGKPLAAQPAAVSGIPAEVVAAISGAVAVVCGSAAQITDIRPSAGRSQGDGSAWGRAGQYENTRPF